MKKVIETLRGDVASIIGELDTLPLLLISKPNSLVYSIIVNNNIHVLYSIL